MYPEQKERVDLTIVIDKISNNNLKISKSVITEPKKQK